MEKNKQTNAAGQPEGESVESHLQEAFKSILKSKFGENSGLIGTGVVIASKVNAPFESKKKQWWEVMELTISTGESTFVYKEFAEVAGANAKTIKEIPQFAAVRIRVEKAETENGGLCTVMGEIEIV